MAKTALLKLAFGLQAACALGYGVLACGSEATNASGTSATTATGAGGSSGTSSSGAAGDAGRPPPDSGACHMQEGCVLCSDDNWHCNGFVAPPCPPDATLGASCAEGSNCILCTSGS